MCVFSIGEKIARTMSTNEPVTGEGGRKYQGESFNGRRRKRREWVKGLAKKQNYIVKKIVQVRLNK